ncbi:MAG TPA: hypothetical protein VKP61_18675 [Candidatus Acidoferrum sp.]|nr:hypothetical protein [Candidatus Acidoferrum sp.]
MRRTLLILSTLAGVTSALPSFAAGNSGPDVAAAPAPIHRSIVCHDTLSVPMTADSDQAPPMQVIGYLGCGEEVAVLSDSESYTTQIRTAEGKSGYVARMYLFSVPGNSTKDRPTVEGEVADNGIARWRAGAPGSDRFFTSESLVESLTANGITVQVSLQDTGWKLRASVVIVNEGVVQVRFNPASFTLDELKPRLRALAYQTPRDPAKAMTRQVYGANASAPASATYTDAAYKSSDYAPATPNYFARQASQMESAVLQAEALSPKQQTSGVVWFQRDKNAQELNLRIFVGDQIFEFPFSFPQQN